MTSRWDEPELRARLVEECRRHIESYGATLYGQFFNVYEASGLEEAAEWLAGEIAGVFRDA